MNELKKKLEELARLEAIADKADAEMMADPESAEKEAAFDAAYQAEYSAFMAATEVIVKMTNGKIGIKTALQMIRAKRSEILALVA